MLLERTLTQLDIGRVTPQRARELGCLGYMQWLGGLPGNAPYLPEAIRAHAMAAPFCPTSPAVAVFCELLSASMTPSPELLPLALPDPLRRGGARARRLSL